MKRVADHPCFYDGLVLVSGTTGAVWRVHAPGRWRVDRRVGWWLRRMAERACALLRLRIPVRAQTARLTLTTDWGPVDVRVVRDVESVVTWCDGLDDVVMTGKGK